MTPLQQLFWKKNYRTSANRATYGCTMWTKNSLLKTFCDIFTCGEPVQWKLLWLLPKHIPMRIPIFVHLSEYLY